MKVLVAGGGIGGLTAALCLARDGHQVQVYEQAPGFTEVGAGIQLSPNCTRVLHHLGLENDLRADACLPEGTQFRHWRTGRIISESTLGSAMLERYGHPYYHIHRADLLRTLELAAKREAGIRLVCNARVEQIDQTHDRVSVDASGETDNADMLVGADGIHSVIRAALWGNEQPRFTGNVAWRALVPAGRLPEGLIRPVTTVWWGPRKHFVHYYISRGELVNCVCVVEKSGWEVESWSERGDHGELTSDFAGWHPSVRRLIEDMDRGSLFKRALYDRTPMNAWGKGRVTLLGDACHPTLPFMAQGAAMAIEDAAVLAGCLRTADSIPAALVRYENLRKKRTASVQLRSQRNATVFHLSGFMAWLRNRAAKAASTRAMHNLFRYDAIEAARDRTPPSQVIRPHSENEPPVKHL